MNKLNIILIRYPIVQRLISLLLLLIYNLLLNPNIVFADWNWISYTDTNPLPFDKWSAVYQSDNPDYRDVINTRYDAYIVLQERELQARRNVKVELLNELVQSYNKKLYTSQDPLVNVIGQYLYNHKVCTLNEIALLVPSIFKEPQLYDLAGSHIEEQTTYKAFFNMLMATKDPKVMHAFAMYSAKIYTYTYYKNHPNLTPQQITGVYEKILARIFKEYTYIFEIDQHE